MLSLLHVFLKVTLKTFLKVLLRVFEGFAILMKNLKSALENIKITQFFEIKTHVKKKKISNKKNLTREETRKPKLHKAFLPTLCHLITQYNPLLPNPGP